MAENAAGDTFSGMRASASKQSWLAVLLLLGGCESPPPAQPQTPPPKPALHVPQTPQLEAYGACNGVCLEHAMTCQGPAPRDPGHERLNEHCKREQDACEVQCSLAAVSPGAQDKSACADCITPCKDAVQHDSDELDSYRILACMCECKKSRGGCGSSAAALDECALAFTPR
jgi:hypothetical protein